MLFTATAINMLYSVILERKHTADSGISRQIHVRKHRASFHRGSLASHFAANLLSATVFPLAVRKYYEQLKGTCLPWHSFEQHTSAHRSFVFGAHTRGKIAASDTLLSLFGLSTASVSRLFLHWYDGNIKFDFGLICAVRSSNLGSLLSVLPRHESLSRIISTADSAKRPNMLCLRYAYSVPFAKHRGICRIWAWFGLHHFCVRIVLGCVNGVVVDNFRLRLTCCIFAVLLYDIEEMESVYM